MVGLSQEQISKAACLSDRELERRVVNYLVQRQVAARRLIQVAADRGTVVLCGRVPSFYQKQLCLNCCARVAGVVKLVDEIGSRRPPTPVSRNGGTPQRRRCTVPVLYVRQLGQATLRSGGSPGP